MTQETQKKFKESATGHYATDEYLTKHPVSTADIIRNARQSTLANDTELSRRGRNWDKMKKGAGLAIASALIALPVVKGMTNEIPDAQREAEKAEEVKENLVELRGTDLDPDTAGVQADPNVIDIDPNMPGIQVEGSQPVQELDSSPKE